MQSFRDYENFQNESRKNLSQKWINYYKVDGITKQKSYNMRYTPNTPVEGAIYTLSTMMQTLNDTLSSADDGTRTGKVQRGYDELEKFFLKVQKTGLLGKDVSLTSLLLKFPQLFSFIRKNNIRSSLVSEIIDNPDIDDEIKALLIQDIPTSQQHLFLEDIKKTNKTNATQKALSTVSQISQSRINPMYAQLLKSVKGFLNITGYTNLPPNLEQVFNNIVGDIKYMAETRDFTDDDVMELHGEISGFEDALMNTADEIRSKPSHHPIVNENDDDDNPNYTKNIVGNDYFTVLDMDEYEKDLAKQQQINDEFEQMLEADSELLGSTNKKVLGKMRKAYIKEASKKQNDNKKKKKPSTAVSSPTSAQRGKKKVATKSDDDVFADYEDNGTFTDDGNDVGFTDYEGKGKPKKRKASKPKTKTATKKKASKPKPKPKRTSSKKKKAGCGDCKKVSFLPSGISNY